MRDTYGNPKMEEDQAGGSGVQGQCQLRETLSQKERGLCKAQEVARDS